MRNELLVHADTARTEMTFGFETILPELPPLSLYVHIPWCVRKCPYCDFNSHEARSPIPEGRYVDALLADLDRELAWVQGRRLVSIFIGGGTPSLLAPETIARLLEGVGRRVPVEAGLEITLEANPGSVEAGRFAEFRAAGVNRLSLGIQSLDDERLRALGRIHDRRQALHAAQVARRAGFERLNLDLMYGLPGQGPAEALAELRRTVALEPDHLSWYQLTLEPNTPFHQAPPSGLPDDDALAGIEEEGYAWLEGQGFRRYEVSAFARAGCTCRHNLNYWNFGDYLGIGAGAHGKLSRMAEDSLHVVRQTRPRSPEQYLGDSRGGEASLTPADLRAEFMLNALRLCDGFPPDLFPRHTGLSLADLAPGIRRAEELGLLQTGPERIRPTPLGMRFLNDLLQFFLQ